MTKTPPKLKKIFIVFLILIGAGITISLFKDQLLKSAVCLGVSQVTGTKVTMGSFALNILGQQIRIKDLKIYNPKEFPQEVLLYCPEVSVDYDLKALLKKKLHLAFVIVNLRELVVVRNKEGQLNVDNLKFLKNKSGEPPFETMQFDMLSLNVGRVIYKDLNKNAGSSPQVFYLNIKDKIFRDITSAHQFATLILWETLKSTTIKTAAIQAVASKFGYGSMVIGVVNSLLSPDEVSVEFKKGYDQVFAVCLKVIQSQGVVKEEVKQSGLIKANVEGADVVIKMSRLTNNRVNVTVSARKLLLPKPEVAGSVMYTIEDKLK